MTEQEKAEQGNAAQGDEAQVEQDQGDRNQAIMIAAATAVVVFAVLTSGMLIIRGAMRSSKKGTSVAQAPREKGPATEAPAPPQEKPSEAATKDSPLPIPGLPSAERPKPIPGLPPVELPPAGATAMPSEEDDDKMPESSFITGEIAPLDESILNPTKEDFRRREAAKLKSSLSNYAERLETLEAAIVKATSTGSRAEVVELQAAATSTRSSMASLGAQLAKLGPVSEDPFEKIGTSPPVAVPSLVPSPRPPKRPPRNRVAVPALAEQQDANKQLEDIYDFSKSMTDEKQLALAKELYGLSREAPAGSAEKFIILKKTAEMASDGGDAGLMVEAVDAMAHNFEMDGLKAKGAMLQKFASGANTSKKIESLVQASRRYAGQAIGAGKLDYAQSVATLAYQASQRPQGKEFRKEALDFRRKVQKAAADQQKLEDAKATLEANPEDKYANLVLGEVYCFSRGDWARGLPHLENGSDAALAAAAKQERAGPSSSAAQLDVGDAWWNAAKSRNDDEKKNLMLHAARWYKRALPELTGLDKAKVNRRLEEVGELFGRKPAREEKGREKPTRARTVKRPPDAVQFGGHWYKAFLTEKATWAQAHAGCKWMGGHLVCVESEAEKQFVGKLAKSAAWVGALSNAQGQWFWVTGQPVASRYWENDQRPREAARAMAQRGSWRDRGQNDKYGFICEWDR